MQVRDDFICFFIGYALEKSHVSDLNEDPETVKRNLSVKVNRMLNIFHQPQLTQEELHIFDRVHTWISVMQKGFK